MWCLIVFIHTQWNSRLSKLYCGSLIFLFDTSKMVPYETMEFLPFSLSEKVTHAILILFLRDYFSGTYYGLNSAVTSTSSCSIQEMGGMDGTGWSGKESKPFLWFIDTHPHNRVIRLCLAIGRNFGDGNMGHEHLQHGVTSRSTNFRKLYGKTTVCLATPRST